jgi:hypothetical protein
MAALALVSLGFLQTGIDVERNEAIASFPEAIDFHLSATSGAVIESVEIEFGTDALACGESVTRALPDEEDFSPGTSIEAEWQWNLRETGAFPPGTMVWWRWVIEDSSGETLVTPRQELHFTDETYRWQNLSSDSLSLFWYDGSEEFAQTLFDAGEESLERSRQATGVDVERQIQVYVYASSSEMQSATLFAADWSGGLAFPRHNTTIIGIPETSLDWGQRALVHELSHVTVGNYTFSCVNSEPIWLDEGLAMYAEGEMEPYYVGLLSDAIERDELHSVRELGQIFSNDPELASLSYAQSMSLVGFLIEEYGQEKMLELLDAFSGGVTEDRALTAVYGMNRDELEAAWRERVGAAPMQGMVLSEAMPTRTPFPTLAPIEGPPVAPEVADLSTLSTPTPPGAAGPGEAVASEEEQGLSRWLVPGLVVGTGCLLVVFAAAVGGWLFWRRKRASQQSPSGDLW